MSDTIQSEVLVVDDEDVVVGAVARILSANRLKFRVAQSAEEAVKLSEQSSPDILLTDIKLPGKSGLDLVRICAERFPSVVPICMTGYANAEHVLLSLEAGAVDFLPKPFTVEEVMSVLDRVRRVPGLQGEAEVPVGYYYLDGQSWARKEEDGTLTVGVIDSFLKTVGSIESVEVPSANTMLRQGGVLTRIMVEGGGVHRVWSAAGGRVEESNRRLEMEARLVATRPFDDGWIACVIPTSVDDEVARLARA